MLKMLNDSLNVLLVRWVQLFILLTELNCIGVGTWGHQN